jgi:hypothetical protein
MASAALIQLCSPVSSQVTSMSPSPTGPKLTFPVRSWPSLCPHHHALRARVRGLPRGALEPRALVHARPLQPRARERFAPDRLQPIH